MYLLLSWKVEERPHLKGLPTDPVSIVKAVLAEARAGREVEIYFADAGQLTLVFPAAESTSVEAMLVQK